MIKWGKRVSIEGTGIKCSFYQKKLIQYEFLFFNTSKYIFLYICSLSYNQKKKNYQYELAES